VEVKTDTPEGKTDMPREKVWESDAERKAAKRQHDRLYDLGYQRQPFPPELLGDRDAEAAWCSGVWRAQAEASARPRVDDRLGQVQRGR
jgi:hypothetical protein